MTEPTDASAHERNDDVAIATRIDALLRARRPDATICPSEVARSLVGDDGPWRAWMSRVRDVAATMAEAGRLRVTRGGVAVDARSPGGPIRLGAIPSKGNPP